VTSSAHSLGRYAGALAGLARVGLAIPAKLRVAAQDADAPVRARSLLARRDRPTAVLALWSRMSQAVAGAARELGLVLGKDLDIVGWSIEELYESAYRPGFPDGKVPPAIVWSASAMAQTAVTRLAERRANSNLPPMKISVPVKLRLPQE
jgi:DNA-binding LacI/PurR family transcriptional regulator